MKILLIIVVVGLLLFLGLALIVWIQLTRLGVRAFESTRDMEFEAFDAERAKQMLTLELDATEWADQNGYQFYGAFNVRNSLGAVIQLLAWQRQGYITGEGDAENRVTEFHTGLSADSSVGTTDSPDSAFAPAPERMLIQVFAGADLDTLSQAHVDGESFALKSLGLSLAPESKPLVELMQADCRAKYAHVAQIPFWKLRVLGWYFTRGKRYAGPISLRHDRVSQAGQPA